MNASKKGKAKKGKKVTKQEQTFGFSIDLDHEEPELPLQAAHNQPSEDFKIIEAVHTATEKPQPPPHRYLGGDSDSLEVQPPQREQLIEGGIDQQNTGIVPIETGEAQKQQTTQEAGVQGEIELKDAEKLEVAHVEVDIATKVQLITEENKEIISPKKCHKGRILAEDDQDTIVEKDTFERKAKKQSTNQGKKKTGKAKPAKIQTNQLVFEAEYHQEQSAEISTVHNVIQAQPLNPSECSNKQSASRSPPEQQSPANANLRSQLTPLQQQVTKDESFSVEPRQSEPPAEEDANEVLDAPAGKVELELKFEAQSEEAGGAHEEEVESESTALEMVSILSETKKGKRVKKKDTKLKKAGISFSPQMTLQQLILEAQPPEEKPSITNELTNHSSLCIVEDKVIPEGVVTTPNEAFIHDTQLQCTAQASHWQPQSLSDPQSVEVEPQYPLNSVDADHMKLGQAEKVKPADMGGEDRPDTFGAGEPKEEEIIVQNIVLSVVKKKPVRKQAAKKATTKKTGKQSVCSMEMTDPFETSTDALQMYPSKQSSADMLDPAERRGEQPQAGVGALQKMQQLEYKIEQGSSVQNQAIVQEANGSPGGSSSYPVTPAGISPEHLAGLQPLEVPVTIDMELESKLKQPERQEGHLSAVNEEMESEPLNLTAGGKPKKTLKKQAVKKAKAKTSQITFQATIQMEPQEMVKGEQPQETYNEKVKEKEASLQVTAQSQPPPGRQTDAASLSVQCQRQAIAVYSQQTEDQNNLPACPADSSVINHCHQLEAVQGSMEQRKVSHGPMEKPIFSSQEMKLQEKPLQQSGGRQQVEEFELVVEKVKPKAGKKGNNKGNQKKKGTTKDSNSPFTSLQLQSFLPQSTTDPHHNLRPPNESSSLTTGNSQLLLAKQEKPQQYQGQRQVDQPEAIDQDSIARGHQSVAEAKPGLEETIPRGRFGKQNRKHLINQLVQLVKIRGDHEVRAIRERLRMLEEDVTSRLQRKKEQERSGWACEASELGEKVGVYSRVVCENITLRREIREKDQTRGS